MPSFTIVFLLLSPFLLHGQTIEWHAVPIFAAVGLVFPAVLTILTFASNRALGPVVTGALGNLSPLLSVAVAVAVLHEPLRASQFAGLMVAVLGVFTMTVTRTDDMRDWRTWALLLPLGASVVRGVIPPIIKVGLEVWPNPIAAGLTGYIFSTLTVLAVERIRTGRFLVRAPLAGKLWFAANGICNGIGTLLLYAALGAGPVSLVAPLYATYPLFTVGHEPAVPRQRQDHVSAGRRHLAHRRRRGADPGRVTALKKTAGPRAGVFEFNTEVKGTNFARWALVQRGLGDADRDGRDRDHCEQQAPEHEAPDRQRLGTARRRIEAMCFEAMGFLNERAAENREMLLRHVDLHLLIRILIRSVKI